MLRRCLAVLACTTAAARADSKVTVQLNQTGRDLADQIGASVPDLIGNAEAKIDDLFELEGLPHILHSFADTGAFANHSLGVDYQPDRGDITFGLVADSAIASDARLSSDHVLSATVINYGVIAGVNLGRWGHERWTIAANGSYASTTIHGLTGHLSSGGAHVTYQALPGARRGVVAWTGLHVTTGLEIARWEIGLSSVLNTNFSVTGTKDHATVDMASTGTLTVLAKTYAVPIEVTTGGRLFDVLGLYVGGGFTLAGGSSTATAMLDSELSINADHVPIGTAQITASDSNGPSTATLHALGGLEIHTRHVRFFVQGLIASGERSLSLGLRGGL